jgi:hypothetical protein
MSVKEEAMQRLVQRIPEMQTPHISSMRNLDFKPFPNDLKVWDGVARWMERIAVTSMRDDGSIAKLLTQATETTTPWAGALWKGLDAAIATGSQTTGRALWQWWQQDASLVEKLEARLSPEQSVEGMLFETCPATLSQDVADIVIRAAVKRAWYRLHGAVAAAAYEFPTAVERQLAIDRDQASLAGLEAVVSRASPEQILSSAVHWKDARLAMLAGRTCAGHPDLLHSLVGRDTTWQEIWLAAIEVDPEAWRGPDEPRGVMHQLLALALSGEPVDVRLLKQLAKTPLGDLSAYPQRARVWDGLPREVASLFLSPTADGWLIRFASDGNFDPGLEPELLHAILEEPRLSHFLQECIPAKIAVGAQLFLRFNTLSEPRFERWLVAVTRGAGNIVFTDAVLLGRVAAARRWHKAVSHIADEVKKHSRHDLRPALRECFELLTFWERHKLRLSGVREIPPHSTEDLWEQLTQTAIELYSKGPTESEVWSRAGGKEAALRHEGTGESLWRDAIRLLRRGGGGKITAANLLREMRQDYQGNMTLRWLSEQAEFEDHLLD